MAVNIITSRSSLCWDVRQWQLVTNILGQPAGLSSRVRQSKNNARPPTNEQTD